MPAPQNAASLVVMTTHPVPARTTAGDERLLTRRFGTLVVADLAYFTAIGISFVALPHLVTGPLGSDATGAGIAFGAFAITAIMFHPAAGRLSDTVGRRPMLVAGALMCAVGMVATAQAATLWQVLVIRMVFGVGEAAFFVASLAAVADLAPPSRRGAAISYNSLGLYVGIAGGPVVGEALLRAGGLEAAWYGGAGIAVLAMLAVLGVGETRGPVPTSGTRAGLIHRPAIPAALGFLAATLGMGASSLWRCCVPERWDWPGPGFH